MNQFKTLYLIAIACSWAAYGQLRMHTEEVATPTDLARYLDSQSFPVDTMREGEEVDIEQIINIGKKVWEVIKENQPVVNIKYQYANALPQGVKGSESLERFSPLQYRSYRTYGENTFGMTVYDVTYTVVHRYGGSYEGRGQYLDTVTVLPSHVEAMWGYTVDFNVDKVSTVNIGTKADPIASLALELNFKVSTVIKKSEDHVVFEFRGDSPKVVRTK